MKKYQHSDGRILFVDDGLGGAWATYYRKPSGALKRLVSRYLPVRTTAKEAQADLDAWAAKHGLVEVEVEETN